MPASSAVETMRREMRVSYGPVSPMIGDHFIPPGQQRIEKDRFLLHSSGGIVYDYRRGEGVTIARPADFSTVEENLFLNGSVYAAVASINGLYPVHASAIVHDGKAYAFSGEGASAMPCSTN